MTGSSKKKRGRPRKVKNGRPRTQHVALLKKYVKRQMKEEEKGKKNDQL
jgi:hypothetical protein